ncbi:Holliday junction branch migration protein RuvA [Paraoerskovia sediminicola]|uniref:Holliday junction branch migration protein RuvA n=1 Tax=Paraoerskovia sediminicola TaxID=1138587 RepID=UPI003D9B6279
MSLDRAVIEVNGIGYLVHAVPALLSSLRVGEQARVATTMVVREDSMTLFGFADDDERLVFETVQTVSGVGPRLALAMLAVHTPDALRRAVSGRTSPP